MSNNTNVFSEESKQQVLDTLFALATEVKSTNVAAIKLYLELANEQSSASAPDLSFAQAIELLKSHDTDTITLD